MKDWLTYYKWGFWATIGALTAWQLYRCIESLAGMLIAWVCSL